MKNLTLFWPELANYHLTKDVGIIPFVLRKYYDYNSCILVNNEGLVYDDAKKYLEDLPIKYINNNNDVLIKILKETDVLMVIGIYNFNLDMLNRYKSIRPDGKIYLKTDMNIHWLNRINLSDYIVDILKKCDLISTECENICNIMNNAWPVKIECIPNGYYNFSNLDGSKVLFNEKENIILTVGRIGTFQKATEILLDGFRLCESKIPNWKLKIVGTIEENFKSYIDNFLKSNPHLDSRVEFTGPIKDKNELQNIYRKCKIFCLPSRCEGFPIVFPEAAHNGCYIISTCIDPSYDITDHEKYGRIFPLNNPNYLSQAFIEVCNNEAELERVCNEIQIYANENFDWIKLCGKIDSLLNS